MTPQALVSSYLKRSLKQDAKVAAVILRSVPEFVGHEKVDPWLSRIGAGTIRSSRVLAILEAAKVNGSRPVSSLKIWQRHALAAELDRFAEELP